jgi:hypothetical protein
MSASNVASSARNRAMSCAASRAVTIALIAATSVSQAIARARRDATDQPRASKDSVAASGTAAK